MKILVPILGALLLSFSALATTPVKILLTFDDGPGISNESVVYPWSSTKRILDVLKEEKIAASFFVLTGPDKWLLNTFSKAESEEGFNLITRAVKEGHHLACHWGGTYGSQTKLHPPRLKKPAYDSDGNGVIDKVSEKGNALESDLLHCLKVVGKAIDMGGSQQRISHIRPPLWKYKKGKWDARPTYQLLGLKMVMTDTKLYDGGYYTAGLQRDGKMIRDIVGLVKNKKKNIVVTLHDSNHRTAKNLKRIIQKIEKKLKKNGFKKGRDWSFTNSLEEVEAVLNSY